MDYKLCKNLKNLTVSTFNTRNNTERVKATVNWNLNNEKRLKGSLRSNERTTKRNYGTIRVKRLRGIYLKQRIVENFGSSSNGC